MKVRTWSLLGQHRFAEALTVAAALNATMPDDLMVYGMLTDANIELGRYGAAARALQRMVDLAQRTNDVPVDLVLDDLPAFEAGVEREIIGIAQEALTNAVRHAHARHIVVRAGAVRGVGFRLSVSDDGRGIARDRSNGGFGMTSMHERAERIGASLTIVTAPRSGTEVVLAWEPPSFSIPGHADVAG